MLASPINGNGAARRHQWLRDRERSRLHDRGAAMTVYRPNLFDIIQYIEGTRALTEKTRELLKKPPPDNFLGRRTREPAPLFNNEDALPPSRDHFCRSTTAPRGS